MRNTLFTLVFIGMFLTVVSQVRAQVILGDVGSVACRQAQGDAQNAVATGGPYNNHGSLVSTAAHVVSSLEKAGTITADCSACIVNQFARSIPIDQQTSCGPIIPLAQWARTVTAGDSNSAFLSVSAASDGSIYAAGYISSTVTYNFGNNVTATGTCFPANNIVLVKYDSSGMAQWARTVTAGDGFSTFFGVSAASDGSVYAAGAIFGIGGTYDFGNSVTAAGMYGTYNIVLVKYNSSGVAQWARTVTAGSQDSAFRDVFAASDGSIYAAGYIFGTGTYDFGNNVTAVGAFSGGNIVLVKYDSSGMAQWARTVTAGNNESTFYGVSVASDGSVYAAGQISGTDTYNFGNSITAAGTYSLINIVLVKYDSSGTAQWARTVAAGSNGSHFDRVSAAPDGSVYAAGFITGTSTYDFGNGVTASAGTYSDVNIVLVKYDSSGLAQWARTVVAGSNGSFFNSVFAVSDGSVYASGSIFGSGGTYDFGNGVTAVGSYSIDNLVLVKYDNSGVAQWAQTETAGSNVSFFLGVSATPDGSVYAAGIIAGTGTYDFGNSVTAAGTYSGYNVVLVKYH